MSVPAEARQAIEKAKAYLRSRGLDLGEPYHCYRANIPADYASNMLARVPEHLKDRVAGVLARIPEEKRLRSHWQLTYREPPTAQPGDAYILTLLYVFDDGVVDLKARMRRPGCMSLLLPDDSIPSWSSRPTWTRRTTMTENWCHPCSCGRSD